MDEPEQAENKNDQQLASSISARSFVGPILLSLFVSNILFGSESVYLNWKYFIPLLSAIILLTFILLYSQFHDNQFYVAVIIRTLALSTIFSLGLHLVFAHYGDLLPVWHSLGLYFIISSLFHYGEFQVLAIIDHETVEIRSFLINHSVEYNLALIVCLIEFFLESWIAPQWKFIFHPWITYLGFLVCIFGDGFRKLAMYTAGNNFNHLIQTHRQPNHALITTGVYSIVRHPSYVGWFYWAIGSQLILNNPISFVGFAIVSWNFFESRIRYEEITLVNFFGSKYLRYKKEVPTGLPWINGR